MPSDVPELIDLSLDPSPTPMLDDEGLVDEGRVESKINDPEKSTLPKGRLRKKRKRILPMPVIKMEPTSESPIETKVEVHPRVLQAARLLQRVWRGFFVRRFYRVFRVQWAEARCLYQRKVLRWQEVQSEMEALRIYRGLAASILKDIDRAEGAQAIGALAETHVRIEKSHWKRYRSLQAHVYQLAQKLDELVIQYNAAQEEYDNHVAVTIYWAQHWANDNKRGWILIPDWLRTQINLSFAHTWFAWGLRDRLSLQNWREVQIVMPPKPPKPQKPLRPEQTASSPRVPRIALMMGEREMRELKKLGVELPTFDQIRKAGFGEASPTHLFSGLNPVLLREKRLFAEN